MPNPRDEARYWEDQLTEQRRTALKSFRDSASKWQGTIAGLIGVFSSITFIKGPGTFKDLGASDMLSAVLLGAMFAAAVIAFVALASAARAAQGIPTIEKNWTGDSLKEWQHKEIRRTIQWLNTSRVLSYVAATIFALGWIAVPIVSLLPVPAAPVRALVIFGDGHVRCGTLADPGALKLVVGSQSVSITKEDSVTVVDRCPQ
jgi:hypothetical protein